MSKRIALVITLAPLLLIGCPAEVTTWSNPFDPESIAPAPSLIQGVVVETAWDAGGELIERPVPGATVTVSRSPQPVAAATTDDSGLFSFDDLPPGEYQLLVTAVGYQPQPVPGIDLEVATQVDLGSVYLVSLATTDDASTVSGVTTYEGGNSHEGILVRTVGRPFQALTAPDGSWSLKLAEGTYDIEMSAPDFQPVLVSGYVVPRAQDLQMDPVMLLANPGIIEGVVERQTCAADPRNEVVLPAEGALAAALPVGSTTVADASGVFALGGLPAGSYALRLSLDGHESVTLNSVSVRGGRTTTLPEPLLLPAAKGGVTGRITLTGETNHSGAVVQLEGTPFVTLTGGDGSFFLEGVCAGTNYQLVARRDGFIEQSVGGVTVVSGEIADVGDLQLARQQGGLVLHSGNAFTNQRTVAYQLEAPTGTLDMRMDEDEGLFDDPARAGEGWVPYATNGTYDLLGAEGEAKVFAQVRGSSGVGAKVSDVVILDLSAPASPQVIVEDGSGWSRDPDGVLLLTLTASDAPPLGSSIVTSGLAAYKLLTTDVQACAPAACSDPTQTEWDLAVLQPYNRSLDFPLLRPSLDEEKEVWARFQDRAGNWSASASARVVLDREAPDGALVDIEGGSAWVRTAIVNIDLSAADENQAAGLTMRLAGDSSFSGAVWQPYQSVITWFLSPGDGAKQVFAQFRDPAGNVSSPVSDSITLDTVGPTGARLAIDQAPYSSTRSLTLTTGAQGASEMVVSLAPDFTDISGNAVPWETYDVTTTLQLPDSDGSYVVYGKYRDAAGNETVRLDAPVSLDRSAPVIASVSIVEGSSVATPNVTLLVQAVAGEAYAHEMKVDVEDVASAGVVQGSWGPYNPTQPVTLAAPTGLKRVQVTLRDAAGNVSTPGTADVDWDNSAPQITAVIVASGAAWVTETSVTLDVAATGATELQVSNRADFAGALWQPYASPLAWTLSPGDGPKTVHVRVRDAAGNLDTSSGSVSLDRTVPQPLSLTLDAAATYSTDGIVDVVAGAADAASGIASVLLSNDPGFTAPTAVTWGGSGSETVSGWVLTPGEGARSVYLRVIDVAGNVATNLAGIEVDTGVPAGTVFVDADADGQEDAWATSTGVVLRITAPADTRDMALANGSLDCATASWIAFAASPNWTLDASTDGPKTVVVCLRDAAGNVAVTSDGILLDRQNPTGGILSIDGGATHARSRQVLLRLSGPGDVVSMALVDGPTLPCGTASYEGFSTSSPWTLPSGDGTKQITACLKDAAGLTASVTNSIELDTSPPTGTAVLDGDSDGSGDAFATSASVDVLLTHPSDTTGVAVANELLDCSTASFSSPDTATATTISGHLLGAGDGAKTVVACFRDLAGNRASTFASIILDTGAPSGSVVIDGGAPATSDDLVDLAMGSPSDTTAMKVFNGVVDCAIATIDGPRVTSVAGWDLDPADDISNDGSVTVTVCFTDGAGLVSGATDVIILDRIAPTGTISIDGGASGTRSHVVTLSLTATETATVALANGTGMDCASAAYDPWSATHTWTLAAGEGTRDVKVCFQDAAGNRSSATDAILVDTLPPTGTLVIDGGASHTDSTSVSLTITASADASSIALANDALDCQTASYGPISSPVAWTLGLGEGAQTVIACLRDGAGNVATFRDDILLDTTAPKPLVELGDGSGYAISSPVAVTLSFPADVDGYALAQSSLDCASASYTPVLPGTTSVSTTQVLGGGDGNKVVVACVRDQANNREQNDASVVLDTSDPAGSVLVNGGDTWVTGRSVILFFSAPADVVSMAVADGSSLSCAAATYEPYASVRPWTLPSGDGDKDVVVCFRDRAGRTASDTDRITLDTLRPAGSFVIDSSSPVDGVADDYATSTTVSLAFTAPVSEDLGTLQVAVADGSTLDCATATYQAYPGTDRLAWTLAGPDGLATVTACFQDAAGNTVGAADSIVLDQVAPTASLSIARGQDVTGSDLVDLLVSASGDTTQMKVFNGAVSCASQTIDDPFATSVASWDLDPTNNTANDGTKTVTVCLRDAAGLRATATDVIDLDRIAPTGTIFIDGGASNTRSRVVTLSLTATETASVALANGTGMDCALAAYVPWSATHPWTLAVGEGTREVKVCFQDAAGNRSSATDDILVDTLPPTGTLTIAGGASHTDSTSVSLTITTSADASSIALANSSLDCQTGSYGPISSPVAWSLGLGEGTRSVVACLRDGAGNVATLRDDILLDTTAPVPLLALGDGSGYATSSPVAVTLSFPPDVDGYALAQTSLNCASASYTPVLVGTTSVNTTQPLGGGDGNKVVVACVRDQANNRQQSTASVVLDTSDPAGTVLVNGGDTWATERSVILSFSAPSDVVSMAVADGSSLTCASATYEPYASVLPWTLPSGDGDKDVVVCFRDRAGRTASDTDRITLDTLLPAGSFVIDSSSPVDGVADDYATSTTVSLAFTAPVSEDLGTLQVAVADGSTLDCATATYQAYPGTHRLAWTLAGPDGLATVTACFKDAAGNTVSAADSIVLDQVVPTASLSIARDLLVTGTDLVDLIVSASGDTTQMKVFNGAVSCASQTIDDPYATSVASWDLDPADNTGNDGTKTVTVCLRDAAGLRATATDTIVLDRVAPSVSSVTLDGGAAMTRNTLVDVAVSAADSGSGVSALRLSEASDFSGAPWLGHDGSATVTESLVLSSVGGTKTVYAQVRDAAGNVSVLDGGDSDIIGLDTIAPTITSVSFPNAAEDAVPWSPVEVVVEAYDDQPDAAGYVFMILEGPIDCNTVDYTHWDGRTTATCGLSGCTTSTFARSLSAAEGAKRIDVCLQDPAGNVTAFPSSRTVVLDQTNPTIPTGLVAVPGSEQLSVSWFPSSDTGSGISYYQLEISEPWPSTAPDRYIDVGSVDAVVTELKNGMPYSVRVRAVDRAGKMSGYSPAVIVTPGYRQHLLTAPLPGNDRAATTLSTAQGRLWWPAREASPATGLERIVVASCDLVLDDCSDAGDWEHFRLETGNRTRTHRLELYGTPDELIIPTVENDVGDINPRVGTWHCSRQSDCTDPANWSFLELVAFGATAYSNGPTNDGPLRGAVAPDRTVIVHVGSSGNRTTAFSSCRHGDDCAQAGNWSTVVVPNPVSSEALRNHELVSVVATDTQLLATYSSFVGVCHVGCQLDTGCDLAADWSGPNCAGSNQEDLHLATSTRYIHELVERIDNPSIRRCPQTADCSVFANWSVDNWSVMSDSDEVEMEIIGGRLHVAGVRSGGGEMRLAICEDGDTSGCEDNPDWSVATLSTASGGPRVGLTARGSDVIAGWRDEDQRLRLVLPTALSPEGFRVAPSAGSSSTGELSVRWDASTPRISGHYILLDDPWDLSPGWDSEILIGDPSITSNIVLPLLSGTTYRAAVKSFLADGQRSSAPRTSLVRSARRLQISSSGGAGTRTVDAHDGLLVVARGSGSADQPYVSWCDREQNTCESIAEWTTTSPLVATTPYYSVGVGVDASALYLAARSDAGDLHYSHCAFSSGCDADADWSAPVTLGTGLDTYPMVAVEARGSRIWVAHRDGTGALVVGQCLKSAGCASPANWTTVTVDATPNARFGATLRVAETATSWEAAIVREMDDEVRWYHCDGTATACDAAGDWSQSTLVTHTSVLPGLPHPSLAVSPEDPAEGATFAGAWDDVLRLGVCSTPLSRCGNPSNWVIRDVGEFSTYPDTNVEAIHGYGGERYLAYQEGRFGGKISLWNCADDCYMPDNWRRAGPLVSGTASTTNRTTGRSAAFDQRDGSLFLVWPQFSSRTYALIGARTDVEVLQRSPYVEGGHLVPGRIEAEAYDHGDLGIAYYDRSRGNSGGDLRVDDVDVRECLAGAPCYQVTSSEATEWLEYRVSVGTTGTYTLSLSTASSVGGTLRLEVDGADAAGVLVAPNTGGPDTFQTVSGPGIPLSAGDHVLRLHFEDGDIDVDWLDLL